MHDLSVINDHKNKKRKPWGISGRSTALNMV